MRDMVKDLGFTKGQVLSRDQAIAWFEKRYSKIKEGTVSAHLIRLSTNAPTRVHYKAKPEDDLFFQVDGSHFRLYDSQSDPAPIYEFSEKSTEARTVEEEEQEPISEFAYERDLRNFISKNLSILEAGLRLYEEEGITGVEFPAKGRFIDILALDTQNNYVVAELKVSRGYDRVVGQLLRYMAWVDRNLADPPQQVRGVIVAREITEDLLLACSGLKNVELFEYALSVSLRKIPK
jgi:hypothetical protein